LRLYQRFDVSVDARLLQFIQETISEEITHCDITPSPIFHASDDLNCTLWKFRTLHPNPARLVQLSNILKDMTHITHPQQIEKCSDCLVAEMRKAARGSAPTFEETFIGQGLALNTGFMFQRPNNHHQAELLTGINGCNAYCIIYDFLTELMFGISLIGKTIPITWLNILLTRIAPPPSSTRGIVHMDLSGEPGLNPYINALLERHGYITQHTRACASSQNPTAE
jgi:hypothetical protein